VLLNPLRGVGLVAQVCCAQLGGSRCTQPSRLILECYRNTPGDAVMQLSSKYVCRRPHICRRCACCSAVQMAPRRSCSHGQCSKEWHSRGTQHAAVTDWQRSKEQPEPWHCTKVQRKATCICADMYCARVFHVQTTGSLHASIHTMQRLHMQINSQPCYSIPASCRMTIWCMQIGQQPQVLYTACCT
jgi:hypothetical protein